jgi:hypothetical protein
MTWKRPHRGLIREAEASASIAEVYTEIKSLLRVPQVPVLFQMYAGNGGFLEQLWQALKPVVRTRAFADSAERLLADAYTRMHNYFEIEDLSGGTGPSVTPELARVLEAFQHQDAALLLLLCFAGEAFDNPVGHASTSAEEATAEAFSFSGTALPQLEMSAQTAKILEEARRQSGVGVPPPEFQALAAWPDLLGSFWQNWKRIAESPLLAACENQLLLHSVELAHRLPGPVELSFSALRDSGVSEEDFSGIVRLTQHWHRALVRRLLQVSAAKIAVEGGSGAARLRPDTEAKQESKKEATPTRAA